MHGMWLLIIRIGCTNDFNRPRAFSVILLLVQQTPLPVLTDRQMPPAMSENAARNDRGPFLYIILVLLLLLINGVLFYSTFQTKKNAEELGRQKNEAENMIRAMNDEINDYLLRLETYKTDNETLVDIRDSLRSVVLTKQKDIQKALHEQNFTMRSLTNTKTLLNSARSEIDDLVDDKNEYVVQLDSVAKALNILRLEYDDLSDRYGVVERQAEEQRTELQRVTDLGTVLQAVSVEALGVRDRKNGNEKSQNRAKRVEQIKLCFDLVENRLVAEGKQTLYLKIIGPEGLTLSTGENVFMDRESGEESIYTYRFTFDYQNNPSQRFCTYYEQPAEFLEGTYRAELFHKGYRIGVSELTLD